jgi:RNA polymerase sigma-70 factor (ECF subfamily)
MLLSVLRGVGAPSRKPGRSAVRALGPVPELPDEVLVGRVLAGESRAAGTLYRRHLPYLLGMVVRMLRSRADGEDVVQDAFAIAFDRLATLREPHAFKSWTAQIAVSLVRKRLRRQRLLGAFLGEAAAPDATLELLAAASCSGEVRAELALVDGVLGSLPPAERLAWMLRFVEGEELESVAQLCGCSLSTAKRRIAAASARMDAHVTIEEDG